MLNVQANIVATFLNVVHSSGTITIRVLPDDGPEAEEVYILQLVTASGSAAIDPSANIVRIIVRENIQKHCNM